MYPLITGLLLLSFGLYNFMRAQAVASDNRRHIESGEERYFEEHRAWKSYKNAKPPADSNTVKKRALFAIFGGLLLLVMAAANYAMGRF